MIVKGDNFIFLVCEDGFGLFFYIILFMVYSMCKKYFMVYIIDIFLMFLGIMLILKSEKKLR